MNSFKIRNSDLNVNALWGIIFSIIIIVIGFFQSQTWFIDVGVVTFIVCFLLWLFMKYRVSKLKTSGYKIIAHVDYMSLTHSSGSGGTQVKGSSIYRLVSSALHPVTKEKLEFPTQKLKGKPIVDFKNNPSLDVYLNKNDSTDYWVDISPIKYETNYQDPQLQGYGVYRSNDGTNFELINKISPY